MNRSLKIETKIDKGLEIEIEMKSDYEPGHSWYFDIRSLDIRTQKLIKGWKLRPTVPRSQISGSCGT